MVSSSPAKNATEDRLEMLADLNPTQFAGTVLADLIGFADRRFAHHSIAMSGRIPQNSSKDHSTGIYRFLAPILLAVDHSTELVAGRHRLRRAAALGRRG